MSDANKTNTVELTKSIKLQTDEAGQCQHDDDDAIKYIDQLKATAKDMFNPLDKDDMKELFEKDPNNINSVKTKDIYDYKDVVLKQSKADAAKASTLTTTHHSPAGYLDGNGEGSR